MVFSPTYQASNEANQFQMASSTVNYSNSNDIIHVDFVSDLIRGQYTLLHHGDDEYYGTAYDSTGWDNVANGNRGNDILWGKNNSRDYLRGGKDDDRIVGADGGNDMLFGDYGDDIVKGSLGGISILRGGKGNDQLIGGKRRDLLIGDFGRDTMFGDTGSDLFLLRTDSNKEGYQNLTPNAAETDVIKDFAVNDYLVIEGVGSRWDIDFVWDNNNILVEVKSNNGPQYAGVMENPGFFPSENQLIIGATATDILAAADGDANAFTYDPNLLSSFGI